MARGANVARFYFHRVRLTELIEDDVGIEVRDLDHAREEALIALRGFLAEAIREGRDDFPEAIVISDRRKTRTLLVRLSDALPIGLRDRLGWMFGSRL
jgi:hypothetical protein